MTAELLESLTQCGEPGLQHPLQNTEEDAVGTGTAGGASRAEAAMESFDAVVFGEDSSDGWADTAAAEMAQAVGNDRFPKSRLDEVLCNGNICRLEMTHLGEESYRKFDRELPIVLAWQSQSHTTTKRLDDGEVKSITYYSRDGTTLPSISEE